MSSKPFTLAVVTGILAFLSVAVAVTELTQPWIEFSLLLGIPAGLAAGVFVVVGVYLSLAGESAVRRHQVVATVAGFGASFLVALIVLTGLFTFSMLLGSIVAAVVGLVVATVVYLGEERSGLQHK